MTDQVFDRPGVRPGQQRIEIFSFASHLLVELVVALGCDDDHGPLFLFDDVANVGRKSTQFPIPDELAVADAQGPQQPGRSLIDKNPGGDQRTKEVAFSGFVRADVGLVLGRYVGWHGSSRPARTFRGNQLPESFHDGDRLIKGGRVSGDHQLAGLVHDDGRLTCAIGEPHAPGFIRIGREVSSSYAVELFQELRLIRLWNGIGGGRPGFALRQGYLFSGHGAGVHLDSLDPIPSQPLDVELKALLIHFFCKLHDCFFYGVGEGYVD